MKRIKLLREEKDLKQHHLANILGINRTTYTSYEIERDTIPLNHLNTLCNYFNISLDYAMSLTETKQYKNSKKDIDYKVLAMRLKNLRKENKLTQKEIALVLNTSRSTWTGYEYGKYRIPTLLLYELAKKYHYSMDYLVGKINENKRNKR